MQTIYLDISNKGVVPTIYAKQGDVGRKFLAVITDNGVPYNIPDNSLLSVWYEGDTDAGNYSSIEEKSAFSIDGNKVVVELVAQMLLKPGKGDLCLSVTHGDGGETNTWNIPYEVEYKPGAGSSVPTEYYTALTEAGAAAAKYAAEAKKAAESVSSLFIESSEFAGCYYRTADGIQEWINPPMHLGQEYRTTERWDNKPVYTQVVNCGFAPNVSYKNIAFPYSVIRCLGFCDSGNGYTMSLPLNYGHSGTIVSCHHQSGNIIVYSNDNSSAYTVYAQVWYVKD